MRILKEKENPYSSTYANDGTKWWTLTSMYYGGFSKLSWAETKRPANPSIFQDITCSWAHILPIIPNNIGKEKHTQLLNLF